MTTQQLKDLGFEIQPEEKRAVFRLNEEKNATIIIDSDKSITLDLHGMSIQVREDQQGLSSVESLLRMFDQQKVDYPF